MEPAFFGARRAAGLLQQFRRLSFLPGSRSFAFFFVQIIVTTIRNSFLATRHTPSCPVIFFDLYGVFVPVGTLMNHCCGPDAAFPGEYRRWRWVFSFRGAAGDQ